MQQQLTSLLQESKNYFAQRKKDFIKDYFTFLCFQSISADESYQKELVECAGWVRKQLENAGFTVEIWSESGSEKRPPVIFAQNSKAGPDKPTLLIYNHYDVQPVDPLEEWDSPPFEPRIEGNEIYARGASDNKGQCFYTLQALKKTIEDGTIQFNIKYLIEGEEESGSVALNHYLKTKKDQLKADYLLIVDTGIYRLSDPAITLGVRGLVTLSLTLKGSSYDLHSGEHGGIVYNPNRALVELLSKFYDNEGKIQVPGFYDSITPLSEEERKDLDFTFDEKEYYGHFKARPTGGEKKYSPRESNWIRPNLEINGLSGGYSGPGFKTVIPASAHAKISARLAPGQDPAKIAKEICDFLKSNTPPGIDIEIEVHEGGGPGLRTNSHSAIAKIAASAYSTVFGKPCKKILNGASIPITHGLASASGSDVVLLGVCLPDDHIHAPNEHFGIDRLELGFLVMTQILQSTVLNHGEHS